MMARSYQDAMARSYQDAMTLDSGEQFQFGSVVVEDSWRPRGAQAELQDFCDAGVRDDVKGYRLIAQSSRSRRIACT